MKKIYFQFEIKYNMLDLNKIFLIQSSKFKITISVESYDVKTAENYRNYYVAEKRIVSKLSKTSIQNFGITN